MFTLYLIAAIFISTPCDAAERKYTALQFGATGNDYIRFRYDMAPFRSSFTLTAWIKRVSTSSYYPIVFHYRTNETLILIGADGKYNRAQGDYPLYGIQDKFTTPPGTWFHYALSWSSSTRTIKVYLDGERVARGRTRSGRELSMGGEVWINRVAHSDSSDYVFGGQLYQLNVYSGVLPAKHIEQIADGGLCEVDFGFRSPILKWEDILAKSRTGSVTEVTGCVEEDLDLDLREKLDTMTRELNQTRDELEQVKSQLDAARKLENITQWDVLYREPYYNNVLTEELLNRMKSSWDLLRNFIGVNITDGIIEHFRAYDVEKAVCGVQSSDLLEMWDEVIADSDTDNIMMTRGILQHFVDYHNNHEPCDD